MAEEWSKHATILERKDKEFRRAMEEEVSTLFSFKLSSKYRIWVGVDIIAQCEIDLSIFQAMLSSLVMTVIKFTKFHFSLGI